MSQTNIRGGSPATFGIGARRGVMAGCAVLLVAAAFVYSADTGRFDRSEHGRYGNREYALDALALQYLADFTDDERLIGNEASMFWCLTPVLEEMDRIAPKERSRVALRGRARAMVIRAGGVPKDVPLDGGAEPVGIGIVVMPAEGRPRVL